MRTDGGAAIPCWYDPHAATHAWRARQRAVIEHVGNELAPAAAPRAAVRGDDPSRSPGTEVSIAARVAAPAAADGVAGRPFGDHSGTRRAGDAGRGADIALRGDCRDAGASAGHHRRQRHTACRLRGGTDALSRVRVDARRRAAGLCRRDRAGAAARASRRYLPDEQRHDARCAGARRIAAGAGRRCVRGFVADPSAGRERKARGDGLHRLVYRRRRRSASARAGAGGAGAGAAPLRERRREPVQNGAPARLPGRVPLLRPVLLGGRRLERPRVARRPPRAVLPAFTSAASASRDHRTLLRS